MRGYRSLLVYYETPHGARITTTRNGITGKKEALFKAAGMPKTCTVEIPRSQAAKMLLEGRRAFPRSLIIRRFPNIF